VPNTTASSSLRKTLSNLFSSLLSRTADTTSHSKSNRFGQDELVVVLEDDPNQGNETLDIVVELDDDPATSNHIYTATKKPIQPCILFPKQNKRGFNPKLYQQFAWIEYSRSKNTVHCFVCRMFGRDACLLKEPAWITGVTPFNSNLTHKIHKHNVSIVHLTNRDRYNARIDADRAKVTIMIRLNNQHENIAIRNRLNLKRVFEVVLFLSKQGLPFRGHNENRYESKNSGNFLELIEFRKK
jgi:hypothetical protein